MTYSEKEHKHQSERLTFLPQDYVPYRNEGGVKTFGVISFDGYTCKVVYQHTPPAFGGYITRELTYGSPVYCPDATRHHHKHAKMYGTMPHLVFFDSQKSAEKAGFRRCKICLPAE